MSVPSICRFLHRGRVRYGLFGESGDQIALLDDWSDDNALGLDWANPVAGDTIIARPAELLPPVPPPQKVICIGLNYRDHAVETGAEIPSQPVVFSKFNTALIGDGQSIVLPAASRQVDYEAELVVVVGKTAKHVRASNSLEYVLGYTAGHDVSARDWQKGRPGGQWLLGKSFDTFGPLGPTVVAASHFGDPADISVKMELNGDIVQHSRTDQLIFDVPALIAHLSSIMTLIPGDVIFTGTPPGVGAARTPPRFLQSGDQCDVTVGGIPTLTNRCVDE